MKTVPLFGTVFKRYKIKKIINKLLLAGDKFMLEIHLRQAGLLTVLAKYLLKKNIWKVQRKTGFKM